VHEIKNRHFREWPKADIVVVLNYVRLGGQFENWAGITMKPCTG